MEEIKYKNSVQSTVAEPEQTPRKEYVPPKAEIILLAPKEQLSAWGYKYSDFDNVADRWAIGQWSGFQSCPDSGVAGGITNPDGWSLPATSST